MIKTTIYLTVITVWLLVTGCSKAPTPTKSEETVSGPDKPQAEKSRIELPSGFPPGFPVPKLSGHIPADVPPLPSGKTPEQLRPYFDYYSWQIFIALNWPAVPGQRGIPQSPDDPNVFRSAAQGTPTVWGTYKESYELYGQGDQRPSPWESYDVPVNPCGDTAKTAGKKVLVKASKTGWLLDETDQAFSYPLIDQNRNYARYEVHFNEVQYNFVRGKDDDSSTWLYLKKNLPVPPNPPVSMPESIPEKNQPGAIMLKAAWRPMTEADDLTRYYVVDALVYDPSVSKCYEQKMGLVGFHIVQKVKGFKQWIWSTFEQVDNVKRGHGATDTTPISFNNGTDDPKTTGGWANRPPNKATTLAPKSQRTPVQVTRYNPIPTTPPGASTVDINTLYQASVVKGTVWAYYELVFTQWPTDETSSKSSGSGGIYPQDAGIPFPAFNVANTAIETYMQSPEDAKGAGGNSCMSCHYQLADQTDFSWALFLRSHQ